MANNRILAQAALSAATLSNLYTVENTYAHLSAFNICNRSSTQSFFRAAIAVAGAANCNEQYILYDIPIPANSTLLLEIPIDLSINDIVRVYASDGNLSVTLLGDISSTPFSSN